MQAITICVYIYRYQIVVAWWCTEWTDRVSLACIIERFRLR